MKDNNKTSKEEVPMDSGFNRRLNNLEKKIEEDQYKYTAPPIMDGPDMDPHKPDEMKKIEKTIQKDIENAKRDRQSQALVEVIDRWRAVDDKKLSDLKTMIKESGFDLTNLDLGIQELVTETIIEKLNGARKLAQETSLLQEIDYKIKEYSGYKPLDEFLKLSDGDARKIMDDVNSTVESVTNIKNEVNSLKERLRQDIRALSLDANLEGEILKELDADNLEIQSIMVKIENKIIDRLNNKIGDNDDKITKIKTSIASKNLSPEEEQLELDSANYLEARNTDYNNMLNSTSNEDSIAMALESLGKLKNEIEETGKTIKVFAEKIGKLAEKAVEGVSETVDRDLPAMDSEKFLPLGQKPAHQKHITASNQQQPQELSFPGEGQGAIDPKLIQEIVDQAGKLQSQDSFSNNRIPVIKSPSTPSQLV